MSLESRMAQVLAEMSVISEAGAAQHGDIVHGGDHNHAPRGPNRSMADEHREAFRRAAGPIGRHAALEAAEEALILARKAPRREYIPGTLEWKVAIARAEGRVEEVSVLFGCSRQQVYRLRAQYRGTQEEVPLSAYP